MRRIIFAAVAAFALSGCEQDAARVAITFATMKYVDQAPDGSKPARAERVAAVARQAMADLESSDFDVSTFRSKMIERLPSDLSLADRVIAVELISVIADELGERVSNASGGLSQDTRIKAKRVLSWILGATAYYREPPQ